MALIVLCLSRVISVVIMVIFILSYLFLCPIVAFGLSFRLVLIITLVQSIAMMMWLRYVISIVLLLVLALSSCLMMLFHGVIMSVDKVCISLPPETLAQMDYLRKHLGLTPTIKRSQLIQQIIFDAYMRAVTIDQFPTPDGITDYVL